MLTATDQQTRAILEEYWFRTLPEAVSPVRLPQCELADRQSQDERGSCRFEVGEAESADLRDISQNSDVLLFVLTAASAAVLLERYTGQSDLIAGTELPDCPGEPLLLRMTVNARQTVAEVVERVRRATVGAFNHGSYPSAELFHAITTRLGWNPLESVRIGCASDALHGRAPSLSRYEMAILLETRSPSLAVSIAFDARAYDAADIRHFGENLAWVMSQLPRRLSTTVEALPVVCPRQESALHEYNRTASAYPRATIHELFESEVRDHPESIAILDAGRSITYAGLNSTANSVACALVESGIRREDRVALLGECSADAVAGIVGIAKAGACYVPLSPHDPEDRLQSIMKAAECVVIVTTAGLRKKASAAGAVVICIDDLRAEVPRPRDTRSQNDLAYVMYTSGTSGVPKGVMVEHKSIVRLVRNTNYIQFRPDDRMLLSSPLEFDASTFELWGALLNGLTLVVCSKPELLDTERLKALIAESGVTMAWLTAPLYARHVETDPSVFRGLRYLLTGGDVVSPEHVGLARTHCPGLTIINGYGPTENTTFSTAFAVDRDYVERVPIGRPIANSTAYVLNACGELQPFSVTGDLYVGGDGLARGYLDDPERTREKFIAWPGRERLYRTGDLARWRNDGQLEFLGRIDDQVKIRGHRVEPSEIEQRLRQHPDIRQAVVVPCSNAPGETELCAYIVGNPGVDHGLAEYLKRFLPGYMIPAHFVAVDRLPLTYNGKVDRNRLPSALERTPEPSADAPAGVVESKLADIWKKLLDLPHVGIHDDFFDLGGHSMKAIQLVGQIQLEFGVKLGLQHVLRSITIADLAQLLRSATASAYSTIERSAAAPFTELTVSRRVSPICIAANPITRPSISAAATTGTRDWIPRSSDASSGLWWSGMRTCAPASSLMKTDLYRPQIRPWNRT